MRGRHRCIPLLIQDIHWNLGSGVSDGIQSPSRPGPLPAGRLRRSLHARGGPRGGMRTSHFGPGKDMLPQIIVGYSLWS